LPANASVTYTITATLAPGTPCGGTLTNTADADFGSSSTFVDPDETNNSASVSSSISCAVTLVADPGALSFGPQTVGAPSAAQTITVTGTNGALISAISVSGDFTQSNNCSAALSGASCSIEVMFVPGAEGSRSGVLTIASSASASPATVTLSGTGTNSVPSPFSFTALTNVTPGSTQVSNPITVTGTNVPTTISVSSGAAYSINGGLFTATPGVVSPDAQVTLRLTASAAYSTQTSAVLTIGGVTATFTMTTAAQPQLQDVTVTSGGGALSPVMLVALAVLVLLRMCRRRVAPVALLLALITVPAAQRASATEWSPSAANLYFGAAVGGVTTSLTAEKVTGALQAAGYQVIASDVAKSSLSGSLYMGLDLPAGFALEVAWSTLGNTRTELQGVEPPSLEQLLYDASRATRGSGDAWTFAARYRWALQPKLSLDVRTGPYRWVTHSDLWFGSIDQVSRDDRGWGYMLGLGPRYVLSDRWAVALNANYFASTSDNRFVQLTVSIDYHLR
ncbi:MAG: choice-of-anchor D domain-containing protein, partial [Gammaproteobacteria bacterium]|nr:choice-of-anchor D domain-containing protein [Gammaproteobacteria bacterium]